MQRTCSKKYFGIKGNTLAHSRLPNAIKAARSRSIAEGHLLFLGPGTRTLGETVINGTREKYRKRKRMMEREKRERGAQQEAENRVGRYSSSPAVLSFKTGENPFGLVMPGLGWTKRSWCESPVLGREGERTGTDKGD